ncbi:hypothetical protein SDJN03_23903, partial [Cucurbita argyrosperma subsp. sororia]
MKLGRVKWNIEDLERRNKEEGFWSFEFLRSSLGLRANLVNYGFGTERWHELPAIGAEDLREQLRLLWFCRY